MMLVVPEFRRRRDARDPEVVAIDRLVGGRQLFLTDIFQLAQHVIARVWFEDRDLGVVKSPIRELPERADPDVGRNRPNRPVDIHDEPIRVRLGNDAGLLAVLRRIGDQASELAAGPCFLRLGDEGVGENELLKPDGSRPLHGEVAGLVLDDDDARRAGVSAVDEDLVISLFGRLGERGKRSEGDDKSRQKQTGHGGLLRGWGSNPIDRTPMLNQRGNLAKMSCLRD